MNKTILMLGSLGLTMACSHTSYVPQIPDRSGVLMDHGSLVFSVPPSNPLDKIKLSSQEVKGDKLHLQFRVIRKQTYDEKNPETMDPKNLTVQLEGQGDKIAPSEIRAAATGRPLIKLTSAPIQAIDLVYKLPLAGEKAQFSFFIFHWKLQYGVGKTEERSVRFDRTTKQSTYAVDYEDPDFKQYGEDAWYPNGAGWW